MPPLKTLEMFLDWKKKIKQLKKDNLEILEKI